jgi:anti-sigma regulatory factor (Ser/Thr protein kinase)
LAAWVKRKQDSPSEGLIIRREVILPAAPEAALLARAALNDALPARALGPRRDHARLVLSELVTNAVKYGTEHGQDVIRIVIEAEGESLRVEIEQPRPAADLQPVEPRLDAQDFGGLGLYIVDELADDWGTEPGPPGRVWFEFLAMNRRKGPDHPWG